MTKIIEIVNIGRGLQLSASRVRVQDLVPYFQEGCSYEEIIQSIPTLSREEIAVVDHYYRQHQPELGEEDKRIRERVALRKNPEWVEKILAEARAERLARMESLQATKENGESK